MTRTNTLQHVLHLVLVTLIAAVALGAPAGEASAISLRPRGLADDQDLHGGKRCAGRQREDAPPRDALTAAAC